MPQEVPAATLVPVSLHPLVSPVQVSDPLWQVFVGVQASPVAHATHAPA